MAAKQVASGELRLRGYPSTRAELQMTYRNQRTRLTSALLVLLGCWALAPLVFFIPPHLPWAAGAIVAGMYLAYRRWTGEYILHDIEGPCPSCGEVLTIKPDQFVKLPYGIPCYSCHHEPQLHLGRNDLAVGAA